jgi:hypothetical protein
MENTLQVANDKDKKHSKKHHRHHRSHRTKSKERLEGAAKEEGGLDFDLNFNYNINNSVFCRKGR